ncbi:methyltransferase [Actinobacteria bacterium YIM 96077]|uniref:Methyltransferase type 12 n=1 Tax=Phytoactinopolyspora halophila TaxID=1981511 RepID=A0A329QD03_9ACTN|nr:methyltransferase [Phytoactinopolyspora halophila]AYY14167.1 methyltransferase [Actinobacteria bacterium YIM 96077]RAW10240.1 methyltransferase type 12 [Phytoactinopolyspora halophila]
MSTPQRAVAVDWSTEASRLSAAVTEDADWYAAMARALVRPTDRLAADIGCGGAGMAIALAAALPPDTLVIGVDGDDDVFAGARRNVVHAGLDEERVRLVRADLHEELQTSGGTGLDAARGADVIWAAASIHHLGDQQAALDTLAGLLAPGGRLALAEGGLPRRHLPWDLGLGKPGLEARLHAAEDRWFARMRASLPGSVRMPYGWPTALRRAGLVDVATRTWTFHTPAPLDESARARVLDSLAHRVRRVTDDGEMADDDARAWSRLLDPDDPEWLGHRDDVYSLSARSVYLGYRAPSDG